MVNVMMNRLAVDELLGMYKIEPDRRYLLETEINFPHLQSILWFPTKEEYGAENQIVQSNVLDEICIQAGLVLYSDALLNGKEGLPIIPIQKLQKMNDFFYPLKITTVKNSGLPRISNRYVVTAVHLDSKVFNGNYLLKYNVDIENIFNASVLKELQFERKYRLHI
jgi:hypothetical protein